MDEDNLLAIIKSYVDIHQKNILGFNEDAVAVKINNLNFIINIDGWVASTDMPSEISYYSAAYRAVANSLSDIYAKGGTPIGMIASSSVNDDSIVIDIVKGLSAASNDFKINYLGGDINQSNDVVIDVVTFGIAEYIIKRSGAQPGDNVYWLGPPLGRMGAVFGILLDNWVGDRNTAIAEYSKPRLFPEFLEIIKEINVNASIDSSDGLAKSIHLISNLSNVRIDIFFSNILDEWALEVSQKNNADIYNLILYSGEELGIIFTSNSLTDNIAKKYKNLYLIGKVSEGTGVFFNNHPVKNIGWTHFSR